MTDCEKCKFYNGIGFAGVICMALGVEIFGKPKECHYFKVKEGEPK